MKSARERARACMGLSLSVDEIEKRVEGAILAAQREMREEAAKVLETEEARTEMQFDPTSAPAGLAYRVRAIKLEGE